MTEPLRLRRYEAADHDAVWTLHNVALDVAEAHGGHGPWDADLHRVDREYIDAGGEFLVGFYGPGLVAMGALRPHDAALAEIKRMRVHPDWQRRGHGRRLLRELEAVARARGFRRLILDCTTAQHAANALYRSEGYRETHRGTLGRFTLVHYEKTLAPAAE